MNRLCLITLLVTTLLTAGCNNDSEIEEPVLKPIAEHIIGKWQMTGSSVLENDKWEEQINDENVALAMELRSDGTELRVMTFPDGFTALATRPWSVDETTCVLSSGQQRIHKLTENELVTEATQVQDPGTGEITQKLTRWTYRRAMEQDKTMAERLVGKWICSETYDNVDGEWVVRENDIYDVFWIVLKENGICEEYYVKDNKEFPNPTSKWSVNAATCRIRWDGPEDYMIEMPDNDTLVICFESAEGVVMLKDVYHRENNAHNSGNR